MRFVSASSETISAFSAALPQRNDCIYKLCEKYSTVHDNELGYITAKRTGHTIFTGLFCERLAGSWVVWFKIKNSEKVQKFKFVNK